MKRRNRTEAIERMNRLSEQEIPFLFVIDFEEECCIVEPLDEIPPCECMYALGELSNPLDKGPAPKCFTWEPEPYPMERYAKAFDLVMKHLKLGDSFLTNLTCRIGLTTDLSLQTIFHYAQAPFRLWLKDELVCFSPEPFVSVDEGGLIRSFPMKGTIDAGLQDAYSLLLDNEKEAAEHATIVDLIRNDLSKIADEVCVEHYRYVQMVQNHKGAILQTSSAISGRLPEGYAHRWGDLLFELLPAGSISGAPKVKTVQIIREAEGLPRGYYTGVMGYVKGGKMESAVMIRFIEQTPDGKKYYRAGGGITAKSDRNAEYEEVNQKIYVPIY